MNEKKRERQIQWRKQNPEKLAEYDRQYRAKHREYLNAQQRRRRKQHPETFRSAYKKWREKNRERRNELNRRYREKHKDEQRVYFKLYRALNPEKRRVQHLVDYLGLKPNSHCEFCGGTKNLQRHHPNHAHPLIFVTVCPSCHKYAEHSFEEQILERQIT